MCHVLEAVDRERIALCQALSIETGTQIEQMTGSYGHVGARGPTIQTVIANHQAYQEFAFDPAEVLEEVTREDIPYGFMPIVALARQIGVPTPTIDAIVHLQTLTAGEDFTSMGTTLKDLGLAGMNKEQIRRWVETGAV